MIKFFVGRTTDKIFSTKMRLLVIFMTLFSVSACSGTEAVISRWDDHPANPMGIQAALPLQSDTLKSEPAKSTKQKKQPQEHHHDHH